MAWLKEATVAKRNEVIILKKDFTVDQTDITIIPKLLQLFYPYEPQLNHVDLINLLF